MGTYRLSEEARADLFRVYQYGLWKFGEAQADRYYNALVEHFQELVARPRSYPAVDEVREGYRRSVCGTDSVYDRLAGADVELWPSLDGKTRRTGSEFRRIIGMPASTTEGLRRSTFSE